MSKRERVEQGFETGMPMPVRRRFLVSDITQEAMGKALEENRRGICLYMDELHGWVKNFTRYNKGSEEQFYISLFNGYDYISDRKEDARNVSVNDPFACIIGTIQPGVLQEMFKGSKSANGFVERILFAFPEVQEKEYWNDNEIDPSFSNNWNNILQTLIRMDIEREADGRVVPTVMEYSPEARKRVMAWQHGWTDMINAEDDDRKKGIYSKFEIFIHRLCIIIQMCKWLCDGESHTTVDTDTVMKAARLVDYFKETALHVLSILEGSKSGNKQEQLLESLPEQFTRAEGLNIATKLGIPSATYDRFLKRGIGACFEHERGVYKKLMTMINDK